MTNGSGGFVVTADEGEAIWLLGDLYVLKARREDTEGAYSLTEITVAPHAPGPPPHRHGREAEAFYVLEGVLEVQLGANMLAAPAGTFAHVPRGITHTYRNPHDLGARMLVLLTPGGLEGFFREMGESASARALPPAGGGPPDMAKLTRLAE